MITAHIDWFNRMLTVAIQLYFRQGCEYTSIEEVGPPADGWLEDMTGRQEITFNERTAIMLALMPHICPQALDIFFCTEQGFRPSIHRIRRLERSVARRFPAYR